MFDFRMDTLLAACRHMNFTKAAQELSITQPAVSQHIRHLETEYGIRIFDLEGKRLRLTKEGEALANAARAMKHGDECLRRGFREMKGRKGDLVFGTTLTVGEFTIPSRLAGYLKAYPDASVRMIVANTSHLLEGLKSGEIDFAIIEGYFNKMDYEYELLSREKYIGVCGSCCRFDGDGGTIEGLLEERLIVREPGSGTREILERLLGEQNLSITDFRNTVEISNMNAIKKLVALNCGITFLYEAAVRDELKNGQLKEIRIQGYAMTREFTFIWRKGSIFGERYRSLFELFKEPAGK